MSVLVTGATGNVGGRLIDELCQRSVPVRAFVRDPVRAAERFGAAVEVAVGDFADPASIRAALDGIDRVFLSSADGPSKVAHEAAVLVGDGHEGRTYELTGPEAVSYADVARELSHATGAAIEYVDAPEHAARQGLEASGMPGWLVEHLVRVFGLIRSGAFERTTDAVRPLIGREARSFVTFARDHAALFAPLTADQR